MGILSAVLISQRLGMRFSYFAATRGTRLQPSRLQFLKVSLLECAQRYQFVDNDPN